MSRHLSIAVLVLAASAAAPAYSADLIVHVTGVRVHKGMLKVAVYDSAASWDEGGKAVAAEQQTPDADEVTFRFSDFAAGKVAVMAMHDENGNGRLDTGIGIPREGFGFSRDAPVMMGPPSFKRAAFDVGGANVRLTVRVRYIL